MSGGGPAGGLSAAFVDVALGACVVVLVALLLAAAVAAVHRRRAVRARPVDPALPRPRPAVVVHGAKVDDRDARRRQIEVLTARMGWSEPTWLETTAEDPGRGQTRSALSAGADAVLSFGGDGTARMVAQVLAHTSVPMGLLPAGTGNLLARNLGIPPARLEAALQIALDGRDRKIDIGQLEIAETAEAESRREAFLVIAGLGFDAEVMAGTAPLLKDRLGWPAYVVAGLSLLRGRRTTVTLRVDDQPVRQRRVRAVMVGNCGTLQAGIQLMPEAVVDDGWLDVVLVSPRSLLGWLSVTRAVIGRRRHASVEHFRCRSIEVIAERPLHAQVDGDPAGTARVLRASVDPLALTIRVPR